MKDTWNGWCFWALGGAVLLLWEASFVDEPALEYEFLVLPNDGAS